MLRKFINKLMNIGQKNNEKEGIVKFFNKTKGFGFIKINDTEEEIFVHKSNLKDRIKEKDTVKFEVTKDEKGLSAINVRLVK